MNAPRAIGFTALLMTATLMAFASPAQASHDCTHRDSLVLSRIAVGHANAGGEAHWYTLNANEPSRVQIWNTGAQTAMQVITSNCGTLICNTAQLGGTCLVSGGTWAIKVWSSGGSDYAVTVTPVV